MRLLSSFAMGLLFGLGILISGMANPARVLNFFDVAGHWDPSLALVMAGAILVTAPGYRWTLKRQASLLGDSFFVPPGQLIDARLVCGSLIFGIGWGLAGFCPGGALPLLGIAQPQVLLFAAALLSGIVITRIALSRR